MNHSWDTDLSASSDESSALIGGVAGDPALDEDPLGARFPNMATV